jgi:DNA-binding PadR family transcriptional regulator
MTDRPLNATAASLLGFLYSGPSSGWDLLNTARRMIGKFWSITPSQVYRELAAMEEAGLISAGRSGPRDRRPYTLTAKGRRAFEEWIHQEPGPELIRYPLLLTLAFGSHLDPGTMAGFVARHREIHAARLADYLQTREQLTAQPDVDRYSLITLEFGIRYESAVLEWFASLPEEILPAEAELPASLTPRG